VTGRLAQEATSPVAAVTDDTVLVRRLDVTTRPPDEVASMVSDSDGGLLLERFVGRYVLNADARKVWLLIDGHRTVSEVADAVAASTAGEAASVAHAARDLCRRLHELELVEETSLGISVAPNPAASGALST
jgi:hypothetical protein